MQDQSLQWLWLRDVRDCARDALVKLCRWWWGGWDKWRRRGGKERARNKYKAIRRWESYESSFLLSLNTRRTKWILHGYFSDSLNGGQLWMQSKWENVSKRRTGETQKANYKWICSISTSHTKHRSKIANASRCGENCNEVLKYFPMQKTVFPNDRQAHASDIFRETYVYEKFLIEPRG